MVPGSRYSFFGGHGPICVYWILRVLPLSCVSAASSTDCPSMLPGSGHVKCHKCVVRKGLRGPLWRAPWGIWATYSCRLLVPSGSACSRSYMNYFQPTMGCSLVHLILRLDGSTRPDNQREVLNSGLLSAFKDQTFCI